MNDNPLQGADAKVELLDSRCSSRMTRPILFGTNGASALSHCACPMSNTAPCWCAAQRGAAAYHRCHTHISQQLSGHGNASASHILSVTNYSARCALASHFETIYMSAEASVRTARTNRVCDGTTQCNRAFFVTLLHHLIARRAPPTALAH